MAEENPFANAMRPDRGGLPGFIGGMMGVQTTDQAQGSATGEALKALSDLKASGKTSQEAALSFFQSPQGQDFFAHAGPDGLKKLSEGLAQMQTPMPTLNNITPGGMLASTDQNGKTSIAASNPVARPNIVMGPSDVMFSPNGDKIAENTNIKGDEPADVRSFKFFAGLGKLPQDEIQRLAGLKADPTKGGPNSVMSESVDNLVKNFNLDPRTGEAIKAGTLKIIPLKNEIGQDTGDITVYDLSNPNAGAQLIRAQRAGAANPASPVSQPLPGSTPDTGSPAGVLPQVAPAASPPARASSIPENNPNYFGTKSSMFLASGPIAKGLAGASGVSEMVNPKLIIPEGAQAADRQTQIDTLRSDLAAMGQIGGGIGVNKGVLEGYLKLAPTGGFSESPHQAIQKAIRLSEHVQSEIDAQNATYSDQKLPIEQRKAAQALVQGWQRVQRDLPTVDELTKMEAAIRSGTAGAPTISGAADTIAKAGAKALTEVKSEAGKVQNNQGLGNNQPDIDSMSTPKELLAVDPRSLSRENKIKYLRKIDALQRKPNGSAQP